MTAPTTRRSTLVLVATCFLLSGFAALLYQTVWLRQFAILLGTSEQALAVILASYMGGLAIGSWVASKKLDRIRRPVWAYGVLEAGIAACAIAMPLGLALVGQLQVALFGGADQPPAAGSFGQVAFALASVFALILLPTAMMGATLPLLAKHVIHRDREIGPKIGLLYGINTFGAVAGTLAAAFLLLPNLGLMKTTWVGAAINLMIFALTWFAFRGVTASPNETETPTETATDSDPLTTRYRFVLAFALIAGAVSFCYEIIFTRMLSHLLGGSVYAFATMLAGFLLGIAIGGALASRLAIRRDKSVVWFIYAQGLAGLSAIFAYRSLVTASDLPLSDWGGPSATLSQVLVSVLILLPTAICIGATFPLATRILSSGPDDAATSSARVYFFNTLGGIAGAMLTGAMLLPALAYHGATAFAITVNACLAMAMVAVFQTRPVHLIGGIAVLIALAIFGPTEPESILRVSALTGEPMPGEMIFNEVGRSGTVTLFDQEGDVRFQTNGLPEAIVSPLGSSDPFRESAAWLGALPPLIRPEARSMLIVGLGGGVAAAYVPPRIDEIDVFELEPAVVRANEFIARRRDRDPLADPRVKIILNDGRNGLALTSKKYDTIVSQPSHPWTAGASHLYTDEFAATVKDRLTDDGVFLQWMNADFVSPALFRNLAATLLNNFDHVRIYEPVVDNMLFIASDGDIRPEQIDAPELPMNPADAAFYDQMGVRTPTHLLSMLRIDEPTLRDLVGDADIVTDERNLLAMKAPAMLTRLAEKETEKYLDDHAFGKTSPSTMRAICPSLDVLSFAMRQLDRGRKLTDEQAEVLFVDPVNRSIYLALQARGSGDMGAWSEHLVAATKANPADPRPAFLLLAHRSLGMINLPDASVEKLQSRLDERYAKLLSAVDALNENDLQKIYALDSHLAGFGTDEIGYELAVRMRLVWRLADTGPQQESNNRDALEIVDRAAPFLGVDALVPFRIASAVAAQRPRAGLVAAVAYAKSIVLQLTAPEKPSLRRMETLRSTLIKVRQLLDDQNAFRSLDKDDYDAAVNYIDKVIAGDV